MGLILGREFKMILEELKNYKDSKGRRERRHTRKLLEKCSAFYFRTYETSIQESPKFCVSTLATNKDSPSFWALTSGNPSWFYKSKEGLEKDLELNDVTKHCQKTLWEF